MLVQQGGIQERGDLIRLGQITLNTFKATGLFLSPTDYVPQ